MIRSMWISAPTIMDFQQVDSMVALQSIYEELRSTQDELTDIARLVSRIQDRLTNIIRRSEDESRSLEERMADLETDKQDMSRELEGLWELNQELQEQTERAVDARNAALRKLHHARKVIRDLRIGFVAEYEDSDSSKSSSKDTFRTPSVVADVPEISREVVPSRKGGETSPSGRKSGSSGQAGRIVGKTAATSTSSDPEPWRIHYSRPPLSVAITCGPMPWSDLARRLSLDDEMIAKLKRLAGIKEHGLRIQTLTNELVFVYDPIILEGPSSTTHLIDWGHIGWNTQAVAYLTHGRETNPMFHTFFFPVKKDGWYYVGAMTWTPAHLWSMWPKLSGESKVKLTAKLKDRCGWKLGEKKIVGMIEEGSLQQICFEISGQANKAASCSFATKMGFTKGG